MSYLISKKFKLITLSPIHIKGHAATYGEGFVRKDTQFAFAVDHNKLGGYLYEKGGEKLIEKYTTSFEKQKYFSLEKFLKQLPVPYDEEELKTYGVFKGLVNAPMKNDFISNGFGQPFIPGSSLKGAFRTAIMYKMLSELKEKKEKTIQDWLWNRIKKKIDAFEIIKQNGQGRRINKEKENFATKLVFEIFQNYRPDSFKNTDKGPFTDFMKAIKISDSLPLQSNSNADKNIRPKQNVLAVGQIIDLFGNPQIKMNDNKIISPTRILAEKLHSNINAGIKSVKLNDNGEAAEVEFFELKQLPGVSSSPKKDWHRDRQDIAVVSLDSNSESYVSTDKNKNEIRMNVECIEGEFSVQITIDLALLNQFFPDRSKMPFEDIEGLIKIARNFAHKQWEAEKTFFSLTIRKGKVKSNGVKSFYQNANTNPTLRLGWGTGLLGMTIDLLLKEEQRTELRNKVFVDIGKTPAPKSKRLIMKDKYDASLPLGWVKMEEIK